MDYNEKSALVEVWSKVSQVQDIDVVRVKVYRIWKTLNFHASFRNLKARAHVKLSP
jgi:hypothetical protein